MSPSDLKNKLGEIHRSYPHQLDKIFEYLSKRARHRSRTNIRQLYYPMKEREIVDEMPQKVFREIFRLMEEVGLGRFYKSGKEWFFEWYYDVSSIGHFYLEQGDLRKTDDHPHIKKLYTDGSKEIADTKAPSKKTLLNDPDYTQDFFSGHSDENFADYDGHRLVIDLRPDFKVSMVLPKDLSRHEADKIIKFIKASISE